MKLRFIYIFLVTISSYILTAQVNQKEQYKKAELTNFLKIYKYSQDNPFDIIGSMKKNASKIQIEEERFSEILQNQFAGNKIQLSDNETKEMTKLKNLMDKDKSVYDDTFRKYIASQSMTYEKYKEMENLYHQNNKFQKRVNKLYTK